MIVREGGRMALSGPITLANVAAVLEEGRKHLAEGAESVDLQGVTSLDALGLRPRAEPHRIS